MPEEVVFLDDFNLIEVRSFGKVSKKNIEKTVFEIVKIQTEKHAFRVLVDTTKQTEMPNPTEIYNIFTDFPSDVKVALLTNANQKTEKEIYFCETVAINNGKMFKIFVNRNDAIKWLGIKKD